MAFDLLPGVTEELGLLSILSPDEPLSKGGVDKHACSVSPLHEEGCEEVSTLLEVVPVERRAAYDPGVHRPQRLLICQWVQGCHGYIEQWQHSLKR